MAQDRNDIGSMDARGPKKTPLRRPMIVGALAAGVIAIGASGAVAVGTVANPYSAPSTTGSQSKTSISGATTPSSRPGTGKDKRYEHGQSDGQGQRDGMMTGNAAHTGTMSTPGTGMMSGTATGTAMMSGTATGAARSSYLGTRAETRMMKMSGHKCPSPTGQGHKGAGTKTTDPKRANSHAKGVTHPGVMV